MNSIPLTHDEVNQRRKLSAGKIAKNRKLLLQCGFEAIGDSPSLYKHKDLVIYTDAYVAELTDIADVCSWMYHYGKDAGASEVRESFRKLLRI